MQQQLSVKDLSSVFLVFKEREDMDCEFDWDIALDQNNATETGQPRLALPPLDQMLMVIHYILYVIITQFCNRLLHLRI